MIYQLNWQDKEGMFHMVAQAEIRNKEQMMKWWNEIALSNLLPKGAIWFMCGERSEHFVPAITLN